MSLQRKVEQKRKIRGRESIGKRVREGHIWTIPGTAISKRGEKRMHLGHSCGKVDK